MLMYGRSNSVIPIWLAIQSIFSIKIWMNGEQRMLIHISDCGDTTKRKHTSVWPIDTRSLSRSASLKSPLTDWLIKYTTRRTYWILKKISWGRFNLILILKTSQTSHSLNILVTLFIVIKIQYQQHSINVLRG